MKCEVWLGILEEYLGRSIHWIGENSKAHGHGVHLWANGDWYEREWNQFSKQEKGTETFANGYHIVVNTRKEHRMEKELINGKMALCILETL